MTNIINSSVNLTFKKENEYNDCLAEDCGECKYCLDKKRFGGPETL